MRMIMSECADSAFVIGPGGFYDGAALDAAAKAEEQFAARRDMSYSLRDEGLVVMELRHRREMRQRDRSAGLMLALCGLVVALWVGTCLAQINLVHENSGLKAQVADIHGGRIAR